MVNTWLQALKEWNGIRKRQSETEGFKYKYTVPKKNSAHHAEVKKIQEKLNAGKKASSEKPVAKPKPVKKKKKASSEKAIPVAKKK